MNRTPLSDEEITARLETLPGWKVSEGRLVRSYKFANFVEAMGWMVSAALVAEKLNHHPKWSNVWNRVEVELWTHDAGAITGLDFALAEKMENLASQRV